MGCIYSGMEGRSLQEKRKRIIVNRLSLLFLLFLSFLLSASTLHAQDATVHGVVRDSIGKPLEAVSISINGEPGGAISDQKGKYEIKIAPYRDIILIFSYLGFTTERVQLRLKPGEDKLLEIRLISTVRDFQTITVEAIRPGDLTIIRIEPRTIEQLPNVSGNFESFL